MRSILAKILLWSLATMLLCQAALWGVSRWLDRHHEHHRGDPFDSLIGMVQDEAIRAYERGGPEALRAHLKRLDAELPGEHYLTDASGRDLLDGTDRSAFLRRHHAPMGDAPGGRLSLMSKSRRARFRLIWTVEPWFDPPDPLPYIAAVTAVLAAMGTALALSLSAPLRTLRRAMDRFARGDLGVRVHSRRRDEIGAVARAFDDLAERIETLVTAERRLLQDVSHELRSPLTRLDVAIDLAMKREDRGPLLERIRRDVTRLSDLVGELLQLTRAEGDPSARAAEAVPLDDLVRDVVEDAALEAEARDRHLIYRAEIEPIVRGDTELLRRAIENVIRNAIRHAPEGSAVEVALEPGDGGARIVVRDRGPGVPSEHLGAIFDPFFRVERDRGRASGGVGLGLAIARRAVELHGGRIEARNADPGLAVVITLPVVQ